MIFSITGLTILKPSSFLRPLKATREFNSRSKETILQLAKTKELVRRGRHWDTHAHTHPIIHFKFFLISRIFLNSLLSLFFVGDMGRSHELDRLHGSSIFHHPGRDSGSGRRRDRDDYADRDNRPRDSSYRKKAYSQSSQSRDPLPPTEPDREKSLQKGS